MVDTQNRIINTFEFQSNLDVLKKVKSDMEAVTQVAKKNSASVGMVNKAYSNIQAQREHNNQLRVSKKLMDESGLGAHQLSMGLKNMGYQLKGGKLFDEFGRNIKMSTLNMNKLRKASWRFNMNILTLMFGFMALQRIISQFGKSAITTYQKANEDTQGLGKSTWALQAAWEFFKYSLVDALTQSELFKTLVEWLIQVVQWFNRLTPFQKSLIAIGLAFIFIIATVGVLFATLQPLFSYLAAGSILTSIKNIGMLMSKFLLWAILAFFVWSALKGLFDGFSMGTKKANQEGLSFSKVIMFLVQTIIFLSKAIELGGKVIGNTLGILADGFKILMGLILVIVGEGINSIIGWWEGWINMFIEGINICIRGLNKLGWNINEIPSFSMGLHIDTSGIAQEMAAAEQDIKDRAIQMLSMDTPTLSDLWDSSDMNKIMVPSTTTGNVTNNTELVMGDININGATDNIMDNVDILSDKVTDKVMEKVSEQLNRKNDSNTN